VVDRKISASRRAGGGGSHDVSEITAAEIAVFRLVETAAAPDIGRRRGARVVHCSGVHCTVGSPSVAAKDHRWLLLSRRRQLPAHLLAVIAISDRADTAIDGRFNRENPEALEQMWQADRGAESAVELCL
jgi:hypothetical protein